MTSSDRGYTILLSHLHNPGTNLPLSTIQGALAHQLATVSPLPTPLAATAVSCPLYLTQPFTHTKLQSLSTAFRHATHLKYRAQVDAEKTRTKVGSLFGRSIQGNIGQWVTDTLKGVQGGNSVLRLACCSGLLLGVEDLKIGERSEKKEGIDVGRARSGVEDETVVALAEVMDAYGYGFASNPSSVVVEEWEKEFQPAGQDILSLALILASQSLPLVPQHKLKALPLPILARLLTSTINSTFKSGSFLSSVSASVTLSPQHQVHISPSSPLAQTLQSMTSSPLTTSIASISRLTANVLALLLDLPTSSRLEEGIFTISETLDSLNETAKQVEHDWIACPLASATDSEIDPGSKDLTKLIWTTLKTMLFSTIMLAEAILSSIVFVPPRFSHITPATLALQILHTLSHLSFIISEFGGVTTTTQGFEQLKKTFYLALDILAQGDGEQGDSGMQAESYVQKVCFSLNSQRTENAATSPRQAKQAFVLASIEQLVPVLSDKCIRDWVWGVCYPHLSDPSHRDTYESAHSVVLSIFASHAQRQHQQHPGNRTSALTQVSTMTTISNAIGKRWSLVDQRRTTTTPSSGMMNSGGEDKTVGPEGVKFSSSNTTSEEAAVSATFVKRMVPFYAQCLIENSVDGKLSTPQLRLAYAALVKSATVSAFTSGEVTDDMYTLAWYCVQLVLDTIQDLSPHIQNPKGKGKAKDDDEKSVDRVHRLSLMLISTISSLPLPLMLRALDEARKLITAHPRIDSGVLDEAGERGRKAELLEALFDEILEKTGDREKEAALRWWYEYRPTLISESEREKEGQGTPWFWLKSRKEVGRVSSMEVKDVAREENQSSPTVLSRL